MKIGNLDIYGVVYVIANKTNNKVYVGQTINGFGFRYHNNIYKYTSNIHLKYAIKKYGIENFKFSPCHDIAFSKNELDIKETIWINYYNSTNSKYGYNKKTGGANGIPNEETRRKMSEKSRGEKNGNYGRKGAMLGKKLSEETKRKISESHKGKSSKLKGRSIPDEVRVKMSKSCKCKIPVMCKTTKKSFNTVKEASEFYNVDNSSILKCCKGIAKHAGRLSNGVRLEWEYKRSDKNVFEFID